MEQLESGLLIPVPEAEPVVGPHRLELDASAAWGVPAHVTVLYPFLPPGEIDAADRATLAQLFGEIDAFDFELRSIGWFGRDVVYAAPAPDEPFRQLTHLVATRWPDHPPYGGEHGEPTPHLTIGDNAPHSALAAAGRIVESSLPLECAATEVWLMTGSAERGWSKQAAFPLGTRRSAPPGE